MALKKKTVLVGLWRMATWHREQASTQRFLSNNFDEPRWRTAALKNAYALMGKRRFEYAAAFFLLAGALKDAISVLSNQLGDMQLAIAVARIHEGDNGPVLEEFLKNQVLPLAATDSNRWMATWALWMLGKRDKAVRALIVSHTCSLMIQRTRPNHATYIAPARLSIIATRNTKSTIKALPNRRPRTRRPVQATAREVSTDAPWCPFRISTRGMGIYHPHRRTVRAHGL